MKKDEIMIRHEEEKEVLKTNLKNAKPQIYTLKKKFDSEGINSNSSTDTDYKEVCNSRRYRRTPESIVDENFSSNVIMMDGGKFGESRAI